MAIVDLVADTGRPGVIPKVEPRLLGFKLREIFLKIIQIKLKSKLELV